MERITIGDIFLGDFPISQYFGQNPELYKRWNLKGHNGVDFALPSNTPLIAGVDGKIAEVNFDPNGFGNYIKIFDEKQKAAFLFAHLNVVLTKPGKYVSKFEIIGLSGSTGYSTAPHLHYGIYQIDEKGNRLNADNGYNGYIDPLNPKIIQWIIRDPQGIYANHFLR